MAEDPRLTRSESHRGSYGYGPAPAGGEPYAGSAPEGQPGMATPGGLRRVSWGAIIAGAVVALVVYLMLGLLGIGIGATQIDIGAQQAVPEGFGIGAAVWWVLIVLISLFIGGWLAGYLSGIPEKRDGVIHGIVTWGLVMLLTAWFATTAVGTVAAGAWGVVEGGITAVGQQQEAEVGELAQQIDDPEMQQQLEQALTQAQEEAEEVADDVTEAVVQAGIWGFVGMLLAAIVAGLGGMLGAMLTAGRTYLTYGPPAGPAPEREREREREPSRYDYERAERERAERERAERETRPREAYEREPAEREREREEERQRLDRERAERERAEGERRDQH